MKNYVAISRDHSGSMSSIASVAAKDYNENINTFSRAAGKHKIDTFVTVMKCGTSPKYGGDTNNKYETVNTNIFDIPTIDTSKYDTNGAHTPLFDSIGTIIETLSMMADADDQDVSFLVMAITDGGDNSSKKWSAHSLGRKIQELQQTDRWTFVFRVPRGHKNQLVNMGLPAGNIQEWDQTEKGMQQATAQTVAAVDGYYTSRSLGAKSTDKFFTNLTGVSTATIKATMVDVSASVSIWTVLEKEDGIQIRDFCEKRLTPNHMLKGAALYELVKSESKVQDYKQIAIKDKKNGHVYIGQNARDLLGIPHHGDIKLAPGNHGNYVVYVQSTSTNRKVGANTTVLYYPAIGVPFKEGPSSR